MQKVNKSQQMCVTQSKPPQCCPVDTRLRNDFARKENNQYVRAYHLIKYKLMPVVCCVNWKHLLNDTYR